MSAFIGFQTHGLLSYQAQEKSSHELVEADEYLLHRILNGIPEGSKDISPEHLFPMDANMDVMGACEYRNPNSYFHFEIEFLSGLPQRMLCWSGADSAHIPQRYCS